MPNLLFFNPNGQTDEHQGQQNRRCDEKHQDSRETVEQRKKDRKKDRKKCRRTVVIIGGKT
jgi:hypothetical protein